MSETVTRARGVDADYATRYIGEIVTLEIDRPLGSVHPQYDDLRYDVNYGFVPDTVAPDGERRS